MSELKLFPVQSHPVNRERATLRESVYLRAYEVYVQCYGPQKAMIEGGCRGGFSSGELIAFLYASAFPKEQWQARVDEAFRGMNI